MADEVIGLYSNKFLSWMYSWNLWYYDVLQASYQILLINFYTFYCCSFVYQDKKSALLYFFSEDAYIFVFVVQHLNKR